jgi:hypothetical protein
VGDRAHREINDVIKVIPELMKFCSSGIKNLINKSGENKYGK